MSGLKCELYSALSKAFLPTLKQVRLIVVYFMFSITTGRQRFNTQMSALHLSVLICRCSGGHAVNPESNNAVVLTSDA